MIVRAATGQSQSGFTLIELTITTVVMSLVVLTMASLFIAVEDTNRQARNITLAVQLANQQMEIYRNRPYSSLIIGTDNFTASLPAGLRSPRSASAVISEIDPAGLKQVDISISYTEKTHVRKIQSSTLIAARGINR